MPQINLGAWQAFLSRPVASQPTGKDPAAGLPEFRDAIVAELERLVAVAEAEAPVAGPPPEQLPY